MNEKRINDLSLELLDSTETNHWYYRLVYYSFSIRLNRFAIFNVILGLKYTHDGWPRLRLTFDDTMQFNIFYSIKSRKSSYSLFDNELAGLLSWNCLDY